MSFTNVGGNDVIRVVDHLKERIRILQDKVVEQYNKNLKDVDDFMRRLNNSSANLTDEQRANLMKSFEHSQRKNQRAQQSLTDDIYLLKYKLREVEEHGIPAGTKDAMEYIRSLKPPKSSKASKQHGADQIGAPENASNDVASSNSVAVAPTVQSGGLLVPSQNSPARANPHDLEDCLVGDGGVGGGTSVGSKGSGSGASHLGGAVRNVVHEAGSKLNGAASLLAGALKKKVRQHASTDELANISGSAATIEVEANHHPQHLQQPVQQLLQSTVTPGGIDATGGSLPMSNIDNMSYMEQLTSSNHVATNRRKSLMRRMSSLSSGESERKNRFRSLPRGSELADIVSSSSAGHARPANIVSRSAGHRSPAASLDDNLAPVMITQEQLRVTERLRQQEVELAEMRDAFNVKLSETLHSLNDTKNQLDMTIKELKSSREQQQHLQAQLEDMSNHYNVRFRSLESGAEDFGQIVHNVRLNLDDVNQRLDFKVTHSHDNLSDKIGEVREQCELIRRRLANNPLFVTGSSNVHSGVAGVDTYSPFFLRCLNLIGVLISCLLWFVCQMFNFFNVLSAVLSNKTVLLFLLLATVTLIASRFQISIDLWHRFASHWFEELSRILVNLLNIKHEGVS